MMEFYLREVYPWLIKAAVFSSFIPLVALGALITRKRDSKLFKLLLLYAGFIALTELVGQITVYLGTTNNLWIDHLYTPMEFVILSAIYYFTYNGRHFKRGVIIAAAGFVVFSVLNIIWGEDITQMNSLPRMVGGAMLIALAVLYFYQLASEPSHIYLDRDPMFVLSAGVIIYQSGTAMAYSMFNEALAESYDAARMCITVMLILNIFFRVVLLMALKRSPVA